jgi:hypothetical protein
MRLNGRARGAVIALALALNGGNASAQVEDDFNADDLSEAWCGCQIDNRMPVSFPADADDPANLFARIAVDTPMLGGNECDDAECVAAEAPITAAPSISIDTPESLGPSFFEQPSSPPAMLLSAAPAAMETTGTPYCTAQEHECIQRQELRFSSFNPVAEDAYIYSLRFRMPSAADLGDRENSIRWVIAQWKEKPLSRLYDTQPEGWGPSPYLAMRFDDGVLHVTVQDEECRCLVAAAPHPLKELDGWIPDGRGGSTPPVVDGPPAICESSALGARPHTACSKEPDLNLDYSDTPLLVSPLGTWTEMQLRVQSGRHATISLEQDGRPIVTVTGRIGYQHVENPQPGKETKAKFKIGHYRDYMPFPATMDIDWLKVAKVP